MAYLEILTDKESAGVTEIQKKSLVRNTPREENMLEIESAANRTRERLMQEKIEKLKKEEEDWKKVRQQQYQRALKELACVWFGIDETEYNLLSDKAKRQLEELVCEKSRKRFRKQAVAASLFDMLLVAGIASFALFAGDIAGTIMLGLACTLLGFAPWVGLIEGQKIVLLKKQKQKNY